MSSISPKKPRLQSISLRNVKNVLSFSSAVSPEVLEHLDEMEKQRQGSIYELIFTEMQYNNDLDVIVKIFMHPIKSLGLLTREEIGAIFSNIEAIHELNLNFLKDLQKLRSPTERESTNILVKEIGKVLQSWSDKFKVYLPYCSNHVHILDKIEGYKKKYPRFAAFMEERFLLPECRLLSLDSFLIAPLQRICKYPLLVQKIWRCTPQGHPDWEPLKRAYEELSTTVDMVNERTRQLEHIDQLMELQLKLEMGEVDEDFNLVSPKRFLVREGVVAHRLNTKRVEVRLFLLNDLLLIATDGKKGMYKVKEKLSLDTIIVRTRNEGSPREESLEISFAVSNTKALSSSPPSSAGLAATDGCVYTFEYPSVMEAASWEADFVKYVELCVKAKREGGGNTVVTLPSVSGMMDVEGNSATTSTAVPIEPRPHERKERTRSLSTSFPFGGGDKRGTSLRSLRTFFISSPSASLPSSSSSPSQLPSSSDTQKKKRVSGTIASSSVATSSSSTPTENSAGDSSSSEGGSFTLSLEGESSSSVEVDGGDGSSARSSPELMIKESLAAELRLRASAEHKAKQLKEELDALRKKYNHLKEKMEREKKRSKDRMNNEKLKDEVKKTEKLKQENEELMKEKRHLQQDLNCEVEQNKFLKSHLEGLQQTAATHKQLVDLYNRQLGALKGLPAEESTVH